MKAILLLTAGGPLVILMSHESVNDAQFLRKLESKGIKSFIACDVPLDLARERYGAHFKVVEHDLYEKDDLRVLDFNGDRIFNRFRFDELGPPTVVEPPVSAVAQSAPLR